MRLLKQSTARDIVVFMTDSADHVSGKTGLTLTITASKAGDAFASISPTVTELATGWYKVALTSSHTDTLGDLALHITATGADPTDTLMQVLSLLPGEAVTLTSGAVDAILDEVVEGSTTMRQMLRLMSSALFGKASGLATTTAVFRDIGDSKDRITATVDADGNRTAVTLDAT